MTRRQPSGSKRPCRKPAKNSRAKQRPTQTRDRPVAAKLLEHAVLVTTPPTAPARPEPPRVRRAGAWSLPEVRWAAGATALFAVGLVVGTRAGKNIVYALYDNHVAQLLDQAVYH